MRDKLIEAINKFDELDFCIPPDWWIEHLADYLLANGVIVPPCKIGTHLWRVTHPYRQDPKVTEFVVKNFKTVGKKHRLQIEVQAVNVPATNWMYYHQFHTSREDAEKELYEKQHPQESDL